MDSKILILNVHNGYLTEPDFVISIEDFEFLTGKSINWEKRLGKTVIVRRSQGHIKLYDSKCILGEKYKIDNEIYTCEIMIKDKRTMKCLLKQKGKKLKVKYLDEKDIGKWEIK